MYQLLSTTITKYSRDFATFVTKNHSYRTYDWDESKALVDQILNNYSLSDET